ncbi:oligopeptide/dipeptide ABC transporter ATP-binding protein [Actinoplanes sp. NPDC026619]|uniref:oligopeptide/dipeptide ABC transporter ATP-binding protein n=1 Tax=Actinoplanes sp. NPDC026619 TaxID=3155798 RepID=UPI0033CC3947
MTETPLLQVEDLTVTYRTGFRKPPFTAVRGVSFTVRRGETVSIVGESGSGKSTIGGAVLGIRTITGGSVKLNGEDITRTSTRRRRELSAHLQAVFQDPFSSLDPTMTVGDSVAEPLHVAAGVGAAEQYRRTVEALGRVGVAASATGKYPAEFSGGQRQRISIARSIVRAPELVICDEAVSALDVSVQAHVLNLLAGLKERYSTSYLFISHNMAVVRHVSDRVVVLYQGRVMEEGPAEAVCDDPAHPYTRSLLAAVPVPDVARQEQRRQARSAATVATGLSGAGCPFAPRCPFATTECTTTTPPLTEVSPGRTAACLRLDEVTATAPPLALAE